MIRCLLTHISRNQRGQAIRQEQRIEGDLLNIGRAAECKIHLPDHRVSLHHAVIRHADDGRLYIESATNPLNINGTVEQSAELAPGMRINVGPYELVVESIRNPEEFTLTYELLHPLATYVASSAGQAPMTLEETGLSKKRIALWLAGFIAIVFMVLPMTYALSPKLHKMFEHLPVAPDESWNAGNMSPGHRALTMKCGTCHQRPFRAVENSACEHCHKSTPHHIADGALHEQVFRNVRCSECHLDHRGRAGLVRHDTPQCVVCHGRIKSRHEASTLANVHDFSADHPPFRLSIRTGPGDNDVERIAQNERVRLVEVSGLKFSHRVHFEKALIMLPGDKTRDIQCMDCHVPNDSGNRFKTMSMPLTCQQSKCHAMELTPPIEGRRVPHASEKTVMTTLRELFASRAINNVYKDNVAVDDLKRVRLRADAESNRNAVTLFTTAAEGTCLECHEVTHDPKNRETPWKVAPVRVTEHWLPKSRFPHDKHSTVKCTNCHDVMKSEKSTDVAIPTIIKCRECHVGSKQSKTRVSSSCDTCHNFHDVRAQQDHVLAEEPE